MNKINLKVRKHESHHMKKETLFIVAAAAAGLYFMSKVAKTVGGGASPASTGAGRQTAAPAGTQTPNDQLTLAQQYMEYGYGHSVADVYDNAGYLGTTK